MGLQQSSEPSIDQINKPCDYVKTPEQEDKLKIFLLISKIIIKIDPELKRIIKHLYEIDFNEISILEYYHLLPRPENARDLTEIRLLAYQAGCLLPANLQFPAPYHQLFLKLYPSSYIFCLVSNKTRLISKVLDPDHMEVIRLYRSMEKFREMLIGDLINNYPVKIFTDFLGHVISIPLEHENLEQQKEKERRLLSIFEFEDLNNSKYNLEKMINIINHSNFEHLCYILIGLVTEMNFKFNPMIIGHWFDRQL